MRTLILALAILMPVEAWSGGKKAPPSVEPSPTPSASAAPTKCVPPPAEKSLLAIGKGAAEAFQPGGADNAYAQLAMCYANTIFANGCLERRVLTRKFKTLERDLNPQYLASENAKAWATYKKNAPYAVDLRWYSKRFSSVIGYTYFYRDNDPTQGTETRIWTNWRNMGDEKMYAAHLVHESSHQARAGAYGHWSMFQGSYPYGAGDDAEACIEEFFP